MRFAQQKSEVETSGVGFSLRNFSMASYECIQVVLSGAMYDIVQLLLSYIIVYNALCNIHYALCINAFFHEKFIALSQISFAF